MNESFVRYSWLTWIASGSPHSGHSASAGSAAVASLRSRGYPALYQAIYPPVNAKARYPFFSRIDATRALVNSSRQVQYKMIVLSRGSSSWRVSISSGGIRIEPSMIRVMLGHTCEATTSTTTASPASSSALAVSTSIRGPFTRALVILI